MRHLGWTLVLCTLAGCGGGSTYHPIPDGGSPPDLLGFAFDFSGNPFEFPDLSTPFEPSPDLAMGPQKTGCYGELDCITNVCQTGDMTCFNNCVKNTTTRGQSLFNALYTCLFGANGACPTVNMGPCDPQNPDEMTLCGPCLNMAQGPGGACETALNNCLADKP